MPGKPTWKAPIRVPGSISWRPTWRISGSAWKGVRRLRRSGWSWPGCWRRSGWGAAIAAAGPDAGPRLRAAALDGIGELAAVQADFDAQRSSQQESLAIWRALG